MMGSIAWFYRRMQLCAESVDAIYYIAIPLHSPCVCIARDGIQVENARVGGPMCMHHIQQIEQPESGIKPQLLAPGDTV